MLGSKIMNANVGDENGRGTTESRGPARGSLNQTVATFMPQSESFLDNCKNIYRPLDHTRLEIRLLYLAPAENFAEDVHVGLVDVSLLDEHDVERPSYETISYTWELGLGEGKIYLEGEAYNVTANQEAVLRRLRLPDEARMMWMDVVCINQQDVEERSQQVSIMGHIYRRSKQTQIWIGEPNDGWYPDVDLQYIDDTWQAECEPFMRMNVAARIMLMEEPERREEVIPFDKERFLGKTPLQVAFEIISLMVNREHFFRVPFYHFFDDAQRCHASEWWRGVACLTSIMSRLWWDRIWVMQETALSPIPALVHIGEHRIPITDFVRINRCLDVHLGPDGCCNRFQNLALSYKEDSFAQLLSRFIVLRDPRYLRSDPASVPFDRAVTFHHTKQATDPRDHVYALIGRVDIQTLRWLRVDYKLTVQEVWAAATMEYALAQGSLHVICSAVGAYHRNPFNMPSWVVDWQSGETKDNQRDVWKYLWPTRESASFDEIDFDMQRLHLSVRAIELGTVENCSVPALYAVSTDRLNETFYLTMPTASDSNPDADAKPTSASAVEDRENRLGSITVLRGFLDELCEGAPDDSMVWRLLLRSPDLGANFMRGMSQSGSMPDLAPAEDDVTIARASDLQNWIRWFELNDGVPDGSDPTASLALGMMEVTFDALLRGMMLFAANHGEFFGSCAAGAQPGDRVFRIESCTVPLVMRPRPGAESRQSGDVDCFELVSPCYLDNKRDSGMTAEICDKHDFDDARRIVLC